MRHGLCWDILSTGGGVFGLWKMHRDASNGSDPTVSVVQAGHYGEVHHEVCQSVNLHVRHVVK